MLLGLHTYSFSMDMGGMGIGIRYCRDVLGIKKEDQKEQSRETSTLMGF